MQFQIILNIQAIKHETYATFSIIRRTADMPKKWLIKVPESQNTASPRGPGPRKREEGEAPGPPPPVECPSLVGGVLLSHGLAPQYHRRSGA